MSRREARRIALQALFEMTMNQVEPEQVLAYRLADDSLQAKDEEFVHQLVKGSWQHREQLDQVIAQHAYDWRLDRLSRVDLCILRIAVFEMQHVESIPQSASINEAVELAKEFSGTQSSRFINGILGSVASLGASP